MRDWDCDASMVQLPAAFAHETVTSLADPLDNTSSPPASSEMSAAKTIEETELSARERRS